MCSQSQAKIPVDWKVFSGKDGRFRWQVYFGFSGVIAARSPAHGYASYDEAQQVCEMLFNLAA